MKLFNLEKHFMVDPSDKIAQIMEMVKRKQYYIEILGRKLGNI